MRITRLRIQNFRSIRDLTVDLDTKTAHMKGQLVPLTGKEYRVLELLAMHKDTAITKDMFLNHMYGGMDEPDAKIIDVDYVVIGRRTVWRRVTMALAAVFWAAAIGFAVPQIWSFATQIGAFFAQS